ncbi:MAG: phosphatidate cytidylyltransferase [Bacteroides sp.]|nr:phosphatidate cytidylyltransferase [Roseburia sp.]MCM1346657.1 phosphatidate cytidylyltransferase [Bacteroides sp.]MCM1419913.1 phosphatidate cytidylyltransferase [Bacteroides sp.]
MKRNLILRSITGVLFVLVVVGCVLYGVQTYSLLFAVITAMTTWEFCTIVNKNLQMQINRFITTVSAVYLYFAVMGFNLNIAGSEIFIPYLISIIYLFVSELYFDRKNSIFNWAFTMMSQLYIALPLSMLHVMSFFAVPGMVGQPQVVYSPILVLSVFIFLWSSDSGAYCFGSMFGRRRLFPRISPKKSWEGSIGGAIVAILVSQIVASYSMDMNSSDELLNRLAWGGLSLVVVVFGTWGDLVESLLKRKLLIKDSGNILPGHGGMLDRFDSSLLAIPASVVYIYTVNSGVFQNMCEKIFQLMGK